MKLASITLLISIFTSACVTQQVTQGVRDTGDTLSPVIPTISGKKTIQIGEQPDFQNISGQLLSNEDVAPYPLKGQKLKLYKANKLISTAQSGTKGEFTFVGKFEDGKYKIHIQSKLYHGQTELEMHQGSVPEGLIVFANRLPELPGSRRK